MNPTRNSLDEKVRERAVESLTVVVADLNDLYGRVKQAHWNARGMAFIGLHKLLGEFAAELLQHIDLAAERATALGGIFHGSLRDAVRNTKLKGREEPSFPTDLKGWLKRLAEDHAAVGKFVRNSIKKCDEGEDFGTADLLTQLLRRLDLQLWQLEAHIKNHT